MYDYVIVGGGTAGCVLAGRLSERRDVRILLLEAGPASRKLEIGIPSAFARLFRSSLDWNYSTEPQPQLDGRRLYWPRGRMLGGSSAMNAQVHTRGNAADYDAWAAMGNPGWSYRDVLPYFRRAEDCSLGWDDARGPGGAVRIERLRTTNPTTHAFVDAACQLGIPRSTDLNGATPEGVDHVQVTQRRGRRCSAADAYLIPARSRRRLHVVTNALATRIVTEHGRATGVEYVVDGRHETALAGEVILSAGAINSPQLLMLSGIGPAAELERLGLAVVYDLPGVGSGLQDHLAVGVIVRCRRPVTLVDAESPFNLLKYLLLRRGMLTSNVAEALAFVCSGVGADGPDLELIFAPVPFIDHGQVKPDGHGCSIGVVNIAPHSRGRITLRSANPREAPVIDPAYLSDDHAHDLRVLREGVRMAQRIFSAPALAPYTGESIEPPPGTDDETGVDAFIRQQSETLYHPAGTCRMGTDEMSVVDWQLRVHGIERLRVVDASIMPRLVRGHPNTPVMMIAEKAAAMLFAEMRPASAPTLELERPSSWPVHP